jgi:hypothetical protein
MEHTPHTILGLVPFHPIQRRTERTNEEPIMFSSTLLALIPESPAPQDPSTYRASVFKGLFRWTGWPLARNVRSVASALAVTTLALGAAPAPLQAETLRPDPRALP